MTRRFDLLMMRAALALARRGLGTVWPNPAVGAIVVKGDRVLGRGWTGKGGRPHAETEALGRAGEAARGATLYVSLEPCCHWGETPPCTEAIIAAGIGRVVCALEDPDPRVKSGGMRRLREAGIALEEGLCAEEAAEVNAGFLSRMTRGRPLVTLKLATSLDGRIATRSGESRWITGDLARERAHLLRASHDAVLVGTGTVLADDPLLTCRLPGLADRSPVRVALDRRLEIPLSARIVADARAHPIWLLASRQADARRREALVEGGIEVVEIEGESADGLDLGAALRALAARGITRLLIEGGARLAASLLKARLADRLAWFHAPLVIGGDGEPALAELGIDALADAPAFEPISVEAVGEDVLTALRARA